MSDIFHGVPETTNVMELAPSPLKFNPGKMFLVTFPENQMKIELHPDFEALLLKVVKSWPEGVVDDVSAGWLDVRLHGAVAAFLRSWL